jgi:S-adenosylmethionine hydrolase
MFEGISETFGKGSHGEHMALNDRFVFVHIRLLNGNGTRNAGIELGDMLQIICG